MSKRRDKGKEERVRENPKRGGHVKQVREIDAPTQAKAGKT